jgi:hypothetical protein
MQEFIVFDADGVITTRADSLSEAIKAAKSHASDYSPYTINQAVRVVTAETKHTVENFRPAHTPVRTAP